VPYNRKSQNPDAAFDDLVDKKLKELEEMIALLRKQINNKTGH
jgi:hypothetical protein